MTATVESPATDLVVEVQPADLAAGLTAVIPHASTDQTLSALVGVLFSFRADRLLLVTTDRHALAEFTVPLEDGQVDSRPQVDVIVPDDDADELLRLAKAAARQRTRIPLRLSAAAGTVTVTDIMGGSSRRIVGRNGEFPRYESLFPGFAGPAVPADAPQLTLIVETVAAAPQPVGEPVLEIAWNPDLMARFAKATGRNQPLGVAFRGAHKPILLTADRFRGLLMPVRLNR